MNKELLKTLVRIEVASLVKKGVPVKDAIGQAGEKLINDMKEAEYETYCSEHNC